MMYIVLYVLGVVLMMQRRSIPSRCEGKKKSKGKEYNALGIMCTGIFAPSFDFMCEDCKHWKISTYAAMFWPFTLPFIFVRWVRNSITLVPKRRVYVGEEEEYV